MKQLFFALFILLSANILTKGQTTCGMTQENETVYKNDEKAKMAKSDFEKGVLKFKTALKEGNNNRMIDINLTVTIPVVVHIVHPAGEAVGVGTNISDAQIQSQIDVLNEDFQRLNADRFNTPSQFASVSANPNITFKLACIDPNGNSTNGITRTDASNNANNYGYNMKFTSLSGHDAWPTDKYLNMWVGSSLGGGYLGFSQYPWNYNGSPNTDGITVKSTCFGRIGNLQAGKTLGRVATHEVGHWLGLYHIQGPSDSDNCGDDECDDTPTQKKGNFGCPGHPHRTCGNDGDMFMNYMDYTNDDCMNVFTVDQTVRMRSAFFYGARSSFIYNYFHIVGAREALCDNGSRTFTVDNPLCLPVTWSVVAGPATVQPISGTTSATIFKTGDGPVTLRAETGNYVDDIQIQMGLPYLYPNAPEWNGDPTTGYNNVCQGPLIYVNPTVIGGATPSWEKIGGTGNWHWFEDGNGQLSFYFPNVNQTGIFRVTSSNACGAISKEVAYRSVYCNPGDPGGCGQYKISPNPAKSKIDIVPSINPPCRQVVNDVKTKKQSTITISQIRIYDQFGNLKKIQNENKTIQASVNISGMKPGLYRVEIIDGAYKETQQLLIQ